MILKYNIGDNLKLSRVPISKWSELDWVNCSLYPVRGKGLLIFESNGVVSISWTSVSNNLTLDDETSLFTLHFSNLNDYSTLEFVGDNEVFDANTDLISSAYRDGSVTCD